MPKKRTGSGFSSIKRGQTTPRSITKKLSNRMPEDFAKALARDRNAKEFFEKLALTYQKQFIGWIVTAKLPDTRAKRIKESMALLGTGQKLGLK